MSEATSKDVTEIPQDALPVEGGFGADGWEASVKTFWTDFDDGRPTEMVAAMESLAAECPHKDGTALYELGSVCDSVAVRRKPLISMNGPPRLD
ncbi:hypothetical protein [Arthrobacter sp. H5]|uniref:hypothetical protein n=1 Tax=Arthrobacter sp. H5 TaxID=1267973 RepID=UPI0004B239E0|nr:hypothetical protein [Arthrobacter sp. H5]